MANYWRGKTTSGFFVKGKRVSWAYYLSDKIGVQIDQNPFRSGFLGQSGFEIMSLMDKFFPNLPRKIIFDPNVKPTLSKSSWASPDSWSNNGDLVHTWGLRDSSDPGGGILESAPLKKGKYYFEIHFNSDVDWSGTSTKHSFYGSDTLKQIVGKFAPIGYNLPYSFEYNIGRMSYFNLSARIDQGLWGYQPHNIKADSAGEYTGSGDVIMCAYDTNANSNGQGRVCFGYNGVWGGINDPAYYDSSNSIDMNPNNADSADYPTGPGGVGIPLLTSGVRGVDHWTFGVQPYYSLAWRSPMNDSAGEQASVAIDLTFKGGTDIVYDPPTGYEPH